jgi:hypothetical protein
VSNSSPKISPVLGNIAEIAAGGPAREVTWPGRIQLLEAIQHWDRRLWQRLDDIVTPPGTRGKPRELPSYPLRPEDNLSTFHFRLIRRQTLHSRTNNVGSVLERCLYRRANVCPNQPSAGQSGTTCHTR